MAVNSIIFGGVNSADYGIYISGEGVFNAPKRDVEMISIPGRNGAFALDKGRFENIEVTYPAFNFEPDDYASFAQNLSDFRNAISSLRGYQRLTDTFHPDEYRMATYISGLEVKPIKYNTASEFNIVFDCKPQRWLTSGETAVTIGEWGETETASSDIVSVENPNGVLAVKSLEVDLEPIQSGSGDPSPSNVRPISGHTDVVVSRTGKNLFDKNAVETNKYLDITTGLPVNASNYFITDYIPVKQGTPVYIPSSDSVRRWFYNTNKEPTTYLNNSGNQVFTPTEDGFVRVTLNNTIDQNAYQIEYGSTATTYEPFGDTYTTALGTTVYGGTLDVTTGVLTVDKAIVTYDGTEDNWQETTGSGFRQYFITVSGMENSQTAISNRFQGIALSERSSKTGMVLHTDTFIRFSLLNDFCTANGISNVPSWKTWLSSNNVQVVYPLATPQTYQLTAQQIELLTGDNSIWSSGGAITLEYGQNPSVLFNPTLFESSPLLEVEGYGAIGFNGYEIELQNETLGDVLLWNSETLATKYYRRVLVTKNFQSALLNNGDSFSMSALRWSGEQFWYGASEGIVPSGNTATITTTGIANVTANATCTSSQQLDRSWKTIYSFDVSIPQRDYIFGTAKSEQLTINLSASVTDYVGTHTIDVVETVDINYDGGNTVTIEWDNAYAASPNTLMIKMSIIVPEARGESSVSLLGHPTYIDCDLGAAYMIKSGDVISLNQYIDLGSELPTLAAGANEITFDNTVTELKIIPRWWKV